MGREAGCRALERVFKHDQAQLILGIENENDAEDFVAAFIQSVEEPQRRDFGGRCLFVSEPDAWQAFAQLPVPHVLVANHSQELFLIEWQFLPLLNRILGLAEPKTLERRLASTPAFYCEVIAAVFRSEKDDPDKKREPTEIETRIAQNAYALLHGWRISSPAG